MRDLAISPGAAAADSGAAAAGAGGSGGTSAVGGAWPRIHQPLRYANVRAGGGGGPRNREVLPPHVCGSDSRTHALIRRLLAEESQAGLVVVDALETDQPIIYVDTEYQRITGYHATEILGRNSRFMQYRGPYATERHPEIDKLAVIRLRDAISKGEECKVQLLNFLKNGQPVLNSLHILPIFGDPRSSTLVTHFAGLLRLTPFHSSLSPMQSSERNWLAASGSLDHGTYDQLTPLGEMSNSGPNIFMLGPEVLSRLMAELDPWSLARLGTVNRRFKDLCKLNSLWRMVTANHWGEEAADVLDKAGWRLGWANVARQIVTLESLNWRRFRVGGTVNPRSNYSACAVNSVIVMFGGEGLDGQPLNDTYLLNLSDAEPAWQVMEVGNKPQGRWGHTLRWLRDSWVVLFGGCGSEGAMNDLHLLDLSTKVKVWHEVSVASPPSPRSWHSSCTLDGNKMLIFGGKGETGNLLNDTMVLDLMDTAAPCWREVNTTWRPPGVLGHSLCTTKGSKVFMFGGLQASGNVRLRTNDVFLLDLDAGKPSWQYLSGSTLPCGAQVAGQAPKPRLEAVMGQLIGGQVVVFGGSTADGDAECSEVFSIDPEAANPAWQKMDVQGVAPAYGWGFSACTIGNSKVVLTCGTDTGQLLFNEFRELSIVTSDESGPPTGQLIQNPFDTDLQWVAVPPSLGSSNRRDAKGLPFPGLEEKAPAQPQLRIPQVAGVAYPRWHASSSGMTTQVEELEMPEHKRQQLSVEARYHLQSAMTSGSSGGETVTSPVACGEGSNSGGSGSRASAAGKNGSPTGNHLDDNTSTSGRRHLTHPGRKGPSDKVIGSDVMANHRRTSPDNSCPPSSSLDSTPSGEPEEKSSSDRDQEQGTHQHPSQQQKQQQQLRHSFRGDEAGGSS